jgi:hypothetical protein
MSVNHKTNINSSLKYSNLTKKKPHIYINQNTNRKMCIFISPVPQRPTEVRLHTLLTLALDSDERYVPCSGHFIPQVIYYVKFLMGSDSVNQPTVGAAIMACYTEDKLTELMMKKNLSEFHTISTMIRLCATQPENRGPIPLHNAPMQLSTPPSSLWFL